jgi:VanZ family protein
LSSSSILQTRIVVSPLRKLLMWLPTLLWLCTLAAFSTDLFSSEHTGIILRKIIHATYGPISFQQFQTIHFLVRKSAHFVSYGLLGVFAFYSWRAMLPARPRWTLRWSILALALTLLAASMDEFHQTFVASRTGTPRDVLLDMTGALFFQVLIASFIGLKSRRDPRP